MMSKDTDDIKLIKKAIRGNSTAYGYLIEKHRTYLYKMAFLYTKNEQDALEQAKELSDGDFDWSDFDDEQVVEEVDY